MSETCWKVLGIHPTTSKRIIKQAYVDLLKHCRPEEKPSEFKELRKAYEAALERSRFLSVQETIATAGSSGSSAASLSAGDWGREPAVPAREVQEPAGERLEGGPVKTMADLAAAISRLYQDPAKRAVPEEWTRLFAQPVFWNLDTSPDAMRFCVRFLGNQVLLPPSILLLISDRFLHFRQEYARYASDEKTASSARLLIEHIRTLDFRIEHTSLAQLPVTFAELMEHLRLREQIENAFMENDEDTARSLYAQLKPAFAQDWDLHAFMARQYLAAGDFDQAHVLFLKVIAARPHLQDRLDFAELCFRQGDVAQAERCFRDVLHQAPRSLHAQKGVALCGAQGEQAQVWIPLLEELARNSPADMEVRVVLATARRKHARLLHQKIQASPKPEPADVHALAWLLLETGDLDSCAKLFKSRLFKGSGVLETDSTVLAHYLIARENEEEAQEEFSRVIANLSANGQSPLDVLKDMLMHFCNKQTEEVLYASVLPHLADLGHPGASDPDYHYAAAIAHRQVGVTLDRLSPQDKRAHLEQAATCIERAVRMQPENHDYHFERGFILHRLGRYQEALASHEYAQEVHRYVHRLPVCMGDSYAALERFDEALEAFERALTMFNAASYPHYAKSILEKMEAVCRRMGDAETHLATLKRYLALYADDDPLEWSKQVLAMHESYARHCAESSASQADPLRQGVCARLARYFKAEDPKMARYYRELGAGR